MDLAACVGTSLDADKIAHESEPCLGYATGNSTIPSPLTSIFPAMLGGAEATSSPLPFGATKT